MRFILLAILLMFFVSGTASASSYGLYSPQSYNQNFSSEGDERLLFILDLSNSMNEHLEDDTKFNLFHNVITPYPILHEVTDEN